MSVCATQLVQVRLIKSSQSEYSLRQHGLGYFSGSDQALKNIVAEQSICETNGHGLVIPDFSP